MFERDPARYFALAPAGYIHLEQAVYRLAVHTDAILWEGESTGLATFQGLGVSIHLEDLWGSEFSRWLSSDARPRFDARLDSLRMSEHRMRQLLREGQVIAIGQRRDVGSTFRMETEWWAQKLADRWFNDGSCFVVDPTMTGTNRSIAEQLGVDLPEDRGFDADLFVDEAALSRLLQNQTEQAAPDQPMTVATAPGADATPEARTGRPPTVVPAIRQILRDLFPGNQRPYPFDRKATLRMVADRIGTISPSSFDRACKEEWP